MYTYLMKGTRLDERCKQKSKPEYSTIFLDLLVFPSSTLCISNVQEVSLNTPWASVVRNSVRKLSFRLNVATLTSVVVCGNSEYFHPHSGHKNILKVTKLILQFKQKQHRYHISEGASRHFTNEYIRQ